VSAIVAVNSFGDVYDYETGRQLAGAYDYKNKELLNTYEIMKERGKSGSFGMENTTIGVVATNAILSKAEANKVAELAQNGLARSINPVHTMLDGDTVFTMATNEIKGDINLFALKAENDFLTEKYEAGFLIENCELDDIIDDNESWSTLES
jgi:L-aminopeptidase/D-esterase-like protein